MAGLCSVLAWPRRSPTSSQPGHRPSSNGGGDIEVGGGEVRGGEVRRGQGRRFRRPCGRWAGSRGGRGGAGAGGRGGRKDDKWGSQDQDWQADYTAAWTETASDILDPDTSRGWAQDTDHANDDQRRKA